MNAKPHILILTEWFLPGFKAGGPIRSIANLVNALHDICDFRIITRNTDYRETIPYHSIISDEWVEFSPGVMVYYVSAKDLSGLRLKTLLADLSFDVIYLNSMFSWYFTIIPLWLRPSPVILAPRGMLSKGSLAVKQLKKHTFLSIAKSIGLFSNVTFHGTSPDESKDIRRVMGSKSNVREVANFPTIVTQSPAPRKKSVGELKLIYAGRIAPEKNLLFALEILDGYYQGSISMDIFGPVYVHDYALKCQIKASRLPKNIHIRFFDAIAPAELERKFADYHCLLLPTTGENFGHTILEAMAAGCPPIISDQTPWKKLASANAGWDLPLQKKQEYQKVLAELLEADQSVYTAISTGAFSFYQKALDMQGLKAEYLDLFKMVKPPCCSCH